MDLLMCLSCGHFVTSIPGETTPVPRTDTCPQCGERRFEDRTSGTVVETGD